MNAKIKKDLFRYIGDKCNSFLVQLRYLFFTPSFQYVYLFRKTQLSRNKIARLFWRLLLRRCMLRTNIQIPYQTQIGEGFRIVHFGHIVVNPGTIIGRNFNISQGVLIGNAQGKRTGTPVIGDNVCINANAIVIGNCRIGNNVLIAPGAFVNFDVPDNSIVLGNPGKIIQRESSPTDKYIVYHI